MLSIFNMHIQLAWGEIFTVHYSSTYVCTFSLLFLVLLKHSSLITNAHTQMYSHSCRHAASIYY